MSVYTYCLHLSIHTRHLPRSINFISKVAQVLHGFYWQLIFNLCIEPDVSHLTPPLRLIHGSTIIDASGALVNNDRNGRTFSWFAYGISWICWMHVVNIDLHSVSSPVEVSHYLFCDMSRNISLGSISWTRTILIWWGLWSFLSCTKVHHKKIQKVAWAGDAWVLDWSGALLLYEYICKQMCVDLKA